MSDNIRLLPQAAVKGIASGLLMMALFTSLWTGIAYGGLHTGSYWPVLSVFVIFIVLFVVNGYKLYSAAKYFPAIMSNEDKEREKKTGKWFGIIFGAEGLGIFIAINIVNNLGHPELDVPALALVVGLHFFPLARVFCRTIDYYLASYSTLVAILAIVLSLNKTFNQSQMLAFTGVGIALATSAYGFYMLMSGRKVMASLKIATQNASA